MRVLLAGSLAERAGQREISLALAGRTTREDLLRALAARIPALAPYLRLSPETGAALPLLVIAGGKWVHRGETIAAEAEVEIHPPIAGG